MTINTTMRFLADIKNNSDSDVAAATRSLEGRRLHIFAGSSRDAMNDITQQEIGKLEDTLASLVAQRELAPELGIALRRRHTALAPDMGKMSEFH